MREAVVLVHGIWMTGLDQMLLARRLRRDGFEVHIMRYRSLRRSPGENAALLNARIRALQADTVHMIGHSLGGIILLHLFQQFPQQKPGRILLMGSPIQGSHVARRLARRPLTARLVLGKSIDQGLLGGAPSWLSDRPLAMIAGTRGIGSGPLLAPGLPKPHDGMVAVIETRAPDLSAHLEMPTTHTGMLFSTPVADCIREYLRSGRWR